MANDDLRSERRRLEERMREIDAQLAKDRPPHTCWHGSPCSCSWGADHGNGTLDDHESHQPSYPDWIEAADALAHAVRDAVTHDFSAGAVIHMQNTRKTYEARRQSRHSHAR